MSAVEATTRSGYSTQAAISLEIASIINNGRIAFWFSTEFNPIHNSPASNPLKIFEELDRSAKTQEYYTGKAASVAANLRWWVHMFTMKGLIYHGERARALYAIKVAQQTHGFFPRVFYLKDVRGATLREQPDEFSVENEPATGGAARRVVPPSDHYLSTTYRVDHEE
jgi:hypothetical protein